MSVGLKQIDGKRGRSSRKRFETLAYVELGPGNGGMLIDVSEGGLSFQGIVPLEPDALLQIVFKLPIISDPIRITGQVAWLNDSGKGGGLRFVELPQTTGRLIKEWIDPQPADPQPTDSASAPEPADDLSDDPSDDLSENTPARFRADETGRPEPSPVLRIMPVAANRVRATASDKPSGQAAGNGSESSHDASFSSSTATHGSKVSGAILTRATGLTSLGASELRKASAIPTHTVEAQRSASSSVGAKPSATRITPFVLGIFVSLAAVAVLVLGAILYQSHRAQALATSNTSSQPVGDPSLASLGLKLERSGKDWQIGWSRNTDVVLKAIGGHLSITDGQIHKEIDLDPGELRSGSIVYTPVTDSMVVRLQIVGGGTAPPASESVRVLSGTAPAPFAETQTHESSPGKSTSSEPRTPSTAPVETPAEIASRKFGEITGNLKSATPSRTAAQATGRAIEVAPPPVGSTVQPESSPNASAFGSAPQPSAPPLPPPTPTPARAAKIDPPQLIARTAPVYPATAQQYHLSGSVELNFRVDANGRVSHVVVVKGNPVLAKAAVEAVLQWRYTPAHDNSIPVESVSSAVISFQPN